MDQQQLDEIKEVIERYLNNPLDILSFPSWASYTTSKVIILVTEVERLQAENERFRAEIAELRGWKPRTPEQVRQSIEDNRFEEEYD